LLPAEFVETTVLREAAAAAEELMTLLAFGFAEADEIALLPDALTFMPTRGTVSAAKATISIATYTAFFVIIIYPSPKLFLRTVIPAFLGSAIYPAFTKTAITYCLSKRQPLKLKFNDTQRFKITDTDD